MQFNAITDSQLFGNQIKIYSHSLLMQSRSNAENEKMKFILIAAVDVERSKITFYHKIEIKHEVYFLKAVVMEQSRTIIKL
jgi:hypothetical protein